MITTADLKSKNLPLTLTRIIGSRATPEAVEASWDVRKRTARAIKRLRGDSAKPRNGRISSATGIAFYWN